MVGYALVVFADGRTYQGLFSADGGNGYGMIKFSNGDEYTGQWDNGVRTGVGVYKHAGTGRIEKTLWENDKMIRVIEVIKA